MLVEAATAMVVPMSASELARGTATALARYTTSFGCPSERAVFCNETAFHVGRDPGIVDG